jgi:phosphoribosylamine--glycine ligase
MTRNGIPTAQAQQVDSDSGLSQALATLQGKGVIKADGLAAGKGVLASEDKTALGQFGRDSLRRGPVLLEEFLEGFELSVFLLIDGENYVLLPPCADFKKAHEGETGPNTGGMGSICPVPWIETRLFNQIESRIVIPTLEGMKNEGLAYKGVLYIGVMVTEAGPKVLEYNVRFGDPETQVLAPVILSDFCNIADAMVSGKLLKMPVRTNDLSCAGIVVASAGYPDDYKTGIPVDLSGIPSTEDVQVFHAGTRLGEDGALLTGGGRCFTVVGMGKDLLTATEVAYGAVDSVRFEGGWYRSDIGKKLFME